MRFEWDEKKNKANIRKHGFDFADAPEMFDHPIVAELDTRYDYDEDRWIGIGTIQGHIVVIAYTERDNGEEIIRVISLRKALKHEREMFRKKIKD